MITTSKQITKHLHSTEFRCKCGCGKIKIEEKLVANLEKLFAKLNASKCIISSGYRESKYDKMVGGSGKGQHVNGRAADCVYYDKKGKIIPSKIVVCVAYDMKLFNGMAIINKNYSHLDTRTSGKYRGDETKGNSNYWTNPYDYFKVTKADVCKYTGEVVSNNYQSHGINTKWYPNVPFGNDDYAGVFGVAMDGLYVDNLEYRVRTGERWLPAVIGRSDYAGIIGQPITDVAIRDATYRVHIKNGSWLPWVNGYDINDFNNGYAGNGQIIDAVEIK